MKARWSWLAFALGLLLGGAVVHKLNLGMVLAAVTIASELATTSRDLARTAAHQKALLERADRAGLAVCPQWRVATLADAELENEGR